MANHTYKFQEDDPDEMNHYCWKCKGITDNIGRDIYEWGDLCDLCIDEEVMLQETSELNLNN